MNVLPPFLSKRFSRAPFVKYLKCKVLHLESLDVYKIDQGSEEENQVAESTKLWLYMALKINYQQKNRMLNTWLIKTVEMTTDTKSP